MQDRFGNWHLDCSSDTIFFKLTYSGKLREIRKRIKKVGICAVDGLSSFKRSARMMTRDGIASGRLARSSFA